MSFTVKIVIIIFTALIAFAFGMVRLGINRLLKGQDEAKESAEKRVDGLRADIKDMTKDIASNSERLVAVETKCKLKKKDCA